MKSRTIYLGGSMRNPEIPVTAEKLREAGYEVFDDWYAPGDKADDAWQDYEATRGRDFHEALNGHHAKHAFSFDLHHLKRCDTFVLQLPCGKSGHIELGFMRGEGKQCHVLMLQQPDRYDLMYRFAHGIWSSREALITALDFDHVNIEP